MSVIRTILKKVPILLRVLLLGLSGSRGILQVSAKTASGPALAETVAEGLWVNTPTGKMYQYPDGNYAAGKMLNISGSVYYFDKNGFSIAGKWLKQGGRYYYFQKNGKMASNKVICTGKKYYYVNKSGARVKSQWVTKKGRKYYFGKNGVRLQNQWLKYKGNYYYLGNSGVMAVSQWIGDYYVGEDGARMTDCIVDGYYLDAAGKKTFQAFEGDYIIVGDSRTVGMEMSCRFDNTLYIAKVNMGYYWLKDTAGITVKNCLEINPHVKVALALGVNDLGNLSLYVQYYRELISQYPETQFYVVSVNPVDERKGALCGYSVKNSQIKAFNKVLKQNFGSSYVNSYKYLLKNGMQTVDGIHYTADTYQKLYQYITAQMGPVSKQTGSE